MNYTLPRLKGKGFVLSRLGGGIGTRGPGETKLEVDRRKIRDKISKIKERLEKTSAIRRERRSLRKKKDIPVVALVGYTNAGKSTLLNALTESSVLAEDKLFATLDPTTRKLVFPEGREILFTDTVGFIKKLPILLIEAFKATLEEVIEADILVHVVDISEENWEEHYKSVKKILTEIGADKPTIIAFNKIDAVSKERLNFIEIEHTRAGGVVFISAVKKIGLDDLIQEVKKIVGSEWEEIELFIPYKFSSIIDLVKRYGNLISLKSAETGFLVNAFLPHNLKEVILNTLQNDKL